MRKYVMHIKSLKHDTSAIAVGLIAGILLAVLLFYFTDYSTTAGNYGLTYVNVQVGLQILLSVLFAVNVALLYQRFLSTSTQEKSIFAAGSFLAAIGGGCSACGITLASFLGLGGALSALPFGGLEIKVLSIALLLYSIHALCNAECKLN